MQPQSIHSADYRNVLPFRDQQVVVVGAANSAIQIAYELAAVANVTLATREAVRFFPQRIFGIDFHVWLKWTRLEKRDGSMIKARLYWIAENIARQLSPANSGVNLCSLRQQVQELSGQVA